MNKHSSSYNQLLKATSILGSSQVVNILLRLIRTKVIAILLGPIGIGLIGTFQSMIDVVSSFCGLGLAAGSVKEISKVNATGNQTKTAKTVLVFKYWFMATALFGLLACATSAYPISVYFFNSSRHAWSIAGLSIAIFFIILASGRHSILQGLRKVTSMAKATVLESIIGLVATIAIYYHFGRAGIVPAFLINSLIMFVCINYYYNKAHIPKAKVSVLRTVNTGVSALRLGIFITLGACLSTVSMLAIRFIISFYTSYEAATGLFQAAWTISGVFAGFVISSAGTDYFAQLCATSDNRKRSKELVNEQTYLITIISTPVVVGIITFSYYILYLLYSGEFALGQTMLHWQMLGIFLKLIATPMAAVLLAKNKGSMYLLSESLFFVTYLTSCYLLIPIYDIMGAGIGFFIAYCVYLASILLMGKYVGKVNWTKGILQPIIVGILLVVAAFYIATYQSWLVFTAGTLLVVVSIAYSLYMLSKVLSIQQIKGWFDKE